MKRRPNPFHRLSRRQFLKVSAAAPATYRLAACAAPAATETEPTTAAGTSAPPTREPVAQPPPAPTQPPPTQAVPTEAALPAQLVPTPACGEQDEVTLAQTEGPFFTPNSPERTSLLEPGLAGTRMVLSGFVLRTDCRPVAGALVDFWHADNDGVYDNVGYRLRGHQFTDEAGRYTLETIVPGLYPGRTRHFHVKVQAPNEPILTTQLYFPDQAQNSADRIFVPDLLMAVEETAEGKVAGFNFVLAG